MAIARQLIFSMSLNEDKLSVGGFYSWAQVVDGNSDGATFSCAYIPPAKATSIAMIQPRAFLGTMGADVMLQTFHEGKTQDGESDINAYAITNMISPALANAQNTNAGSEPLEICRWVNLEMANINALAKGIVVQYAVEAESPHLVSPVWQDMYYDTGNNRAFFPRCLARWIHLKITDTTMLINTDIWGAFVLGFYPLGTRDQGARN